MNIVYTHLMYVKNSLLNKNSVKFSSRNYIINCN